MGELSSFYVGVIILCPLVISVYSQVYPGLAPQSAKLNRTFAQRLNDSLVIPIFTKGDPPPSKVWFLNGHPLPASQQHNELDSTTLYLFDITMSSYGTYTLILQNSVGNDTENFYVVPTGPPEMPTNFAVKSVASSSVTLTWTSGFDYGSKQTFVIGQSKGSIQPYELKRIQGNRRNGGIGNYTATIAGLTRNTRYQVEMYAFNAHGSSGWSPWINFTTKALPPPTSSTITNPSVTTQRTRTVQPSTKRTRPVHHTTQTRIPGQSSAPVVSTVPSSGSHVVPLFTSLTGELVIIYLLKRNP